MQAHGYGLCRRTVTEISRNFGELHGVERSARAAAHMVEDAWFKAIRGSSLDTPAPQRNAYAMAGSRTLPPCSLRGPITILTETNVGRYGT